MVYSRSILYVREYFRADRRRSRKESEGEAMTLLDQGPDGKFISRSEALKAWLPKLLDRALGDETAQVLDVLAGYKERQAAGELRIAADVLDRQDSQCADYWIKQHTRKRAIAAELRATKERIRKL
jgi:hypothetical protein